MATKKLIEVALPLEKMNEASAREKSIRHGHPSTLHLWWARRPLATARAVIWASLVDDPSSHPELFHTEEEQAAERNRLFRILEDLVTWENSNNKDILCVAQKEIYRYCGVKELALLDPFAGGGAIPIEAQRLGIRAYANDLNPVAVMINKSLLEIPPLFANYPAVNPNCNRIKSTFSGLDGLVTDIQYYGELLKNKVFQRVGHLYPKVKIGDGANDITTASAWLWARTVKCPNPGCGCQVPLISSFAISQKKGNEAWVEPVFESGKFRFLVHKGKCPAKYITGTKFVNKDGKGKKGTFLCPRCQEGVIERDYADNEACNKRMGSIPVAVVAEGKRGKLFEQVDFGEAYIEAIEKYYEAHHIADDIPYENTRGTFASNAQGGYYGFFEFKDYFTKRQLCALVTFVRELRLLQTEIEESAIKAGLSNDHVPLKNKGTGALAYSQAIQVYLSFLIDQMTNQSSSVCGWNSTNTQMRCVFSRQAIPMVWDYAECNIFSNSSGSYSNLLELMCKSFSNIPTEGDGVASQADAQTDFGIRDIIVSTDPPYYDNIDYSDLSDYFYVWLKKSIRDIYPELFSTTLVPKTEELIATPYRFDGDSGKAKSFFEDGMLKTCQNIHKYVSEEYPVTIYYAYKQSEVTDSDKGIASSGWETMLNSIIRAGFSITGTWPVRTEKPGRSVGIGANALASSIVLVCRKRSETAPQTTRRNLVNALRRELRPALKKLQESNIAPVDLAQSAIGPGMAVFSQYRRVLEADGSEMTVRSALQVINEEIDLYFNEQVGNMDTASRFCIDLYTQCAYNDIKFGEAEVLANAKGTSIPMMASHGVLYAKAGLVHLVERNELPEKVDTNESNIWMLTQQLTRAMAKGGVNACAEIVFNMFGSNAESAKDLAYRLYTIAERKGWAEEAYAYNNLVVAWPDIQTRAAELKAVQPEQMNLFDLGLLNKE